MSTPPPPIEYEQRLLAYFDILGWSKLTLESEEDESKKDLITRVLNHINHIRGFYGMGGIVEGTGCQVGIASDSFFFSAPLAGFYSQTPFFEVSSLIHRLIKLGLYVRGSIVVGSLFHNQSVIVGPALVRAVDLEKLAIYPRIIIDKSVFEHFQREGVVQSEDGFLTLDWLWHLYEDKNLNNAGKDADQILQIVEQKIIEDVQDKSLLMKHLWMKSYLKLSTRRE